MVFQPKPVSIHEKISSTAVDDCISVIDHDYRCNIHKIKRLFDFIISLFKMNET